jgi:SAM-dependent methyltransferase
MFFLDARIRLCSSVGGHNTVSSYFVSYQLFTESLKNNLFSLLLMTDSGKGRTIKDWYDGDYNLDSERKAVHIYQDKALKLFKRFNPEKRPLKLLDIGCEHGEFSLLLKQAGYDVYGLDLRKKEVEIAKKRGIKAVVGDAEKKLPFKPNSFDAVFTGDIIEHLYDTDFFISEANRVLRKGGIFIITTPNLASLSNRLRLLLGMLPVGSEIRLGQDMAGHIRNYTFPELERQLRKQGFNVVKKVSSNQIFPVQLKIPILRSLAIKLGDYLPNIGSHIIIAARKR